MEDIAAIGRFLRGLSKGEKEDQTQGAHRYPFVTVSRQAGAGGHSFAEALVGRLEQMQQADPLFGGWQHFDKKLCAKVAEDPKLHVSLMDLLDERHRSAIEDYCAQMIAGESPQILVFRSVAKVVRSLASVGKSVIVGRGANLITRGYGRGIHIRLVAPLKSRISRMAERIETSDEDAKKRLEIIDRDRAALIRDYFGSDIEDPLSYDAVYNTDRLSMDAVVEGVVEMIRYQAEVPIAEEEPV